MSTEVPISLFERLIDVYEKLTGPAEFMEQFITGFPWVAASVEYQEIIPEKWPSEKVLHDIYEYWRKKRLEAGKPLLRMFWKKASFNDENPNISFRSRYPEPVWTRRRIGNGLNYYDKENLAKLLEIRNEAFDARNLIMKLHSREKKKLEAIDLDYVAFK